MLSALSIISESLLPSVFCVLCPFVCPPFTLNCHFHMTHPNIMIRINPFAKIFGGGGQSGKKVYKAPTNQRQSSSSALFNLIRNELDLSNSYNTFLFGSCH